MTENNELEHRLAAFAIQALDLEESPESIAESIEPFKRETVAGISTLELDSSIGSVAFLIYHYTLGAIDDNGKTGATIFEDEVQVLERAAKLDTPGPRIMAHAVTDDEAYILATSPAVHRALTTPAHGDSADQVDGAASAQDIDSARRDSAAALADTLVEANRLAKQWLTAIRAAGEQDDEVEHNEIVSFNEEETALALMLFDDANSKELLQAMNLAIETAKQSIEKPDSEDS